MAVFTCENKSAQNVDLTRSFEFLVKSPTHFMEIQFLRAIGAPIPYWSRDMYAGNVDSARNG